MRRHLTEALGLDEVSDDAGDLAVTMLVADEDPVETYIYYRKFIPWEITNALEDALASAHSRWKPAEERDDRSKEDIDPNS